MNLDKKRKRQSGRQARKVQDRYSIWIDDAGKVHSKRYKAPGITAPSSTSDT